MRQTLDGFWDDEQGVATVEYALLLALVVIAGLAAWQNLGGSIRTVLQESSDQIANGIN